MRFVGQEALCLANDFPEGAPDRTQVGIVEVVRTDVDPVVELASGADVVVITREDARDVFRLGGEPAEMAERARQALQAESLVLTLGDQGSAWVSSEGAGKAEAYPTVVIDRLGAGDAFMAGIIDGILDSDLERGVATGTALASLALGTHGDHVIATRDDVERMVSDTHRSVDR